MKLVLYIKLYFLFNCTAIFPGAQTHMLSSFQICMNNINYFYAKLVLTLKSLTKMIKAAAQRE